MPARGSSVNTMAEGLRSLLSEIAQLKATPDADVDFLTQVETAILTRIRADSVAAAGLTQQGPGFGPPPGAASPGLMPADAAPGTAGMMQGPPPINPDELRRLMGQTAGA